MLYTTLRPAAPNARKKLFIERSNTQSSSRVFLGAEIVFDLKEIYIEREREIQWATPMAQHKVAQVSGYKKKTDLFLPPPLSTRTHGVFQCVPFSFVFPVRLTIEQVHQGHLLSDDSPMGKGGSCSHTCSHLPCLPSGVATFTLTSLIVRGEAAKFFAPCMLRQ